MKRIALYAAVYGGVGVVVGVLMALYTKDINDRAMSIPISSVAQPPVTTEVTPDA